MKFALEMLAGVTAITLCAILLMFSIPAYAQEGQTLKQVADATFKLRVNGRPNCSGVFIASSKERDLFLTAAHCVTGKGVISLVNKTNKDKFITLRLVRVHYADDVALLETFFPSIANFPVVDISSQTETDKMEMGSAIMSIGFPKMGSITIFRGDFINREKGALPDTKGVYYKTTVPIIGGSSGGGLFTEVNGRWKLIGICSHYLRGTVLSYFASLKSIQTLLIGVI